MEFAINANHTGAQDVPLALLDESPTNPCQHFDEKGMNELAETIAKSGVLQAILARPKNERLQIVFGARRYRGSQLAGKPTIPTVIREMTDAEMVEAQLVENLQRRDVHPMEEAEGYKRLLSFTEPTYTIQQIAAKVGKTPVYIATRLKLTELCDEVATAFYGNDIGVGHALMLAKLPEDVQKQGLSACFKEMYTGNGDKPSRLLLPVRNLRFWIETNVLLLLKDAPFNKRTPSLSPQPEAVSIAPSVPGRTSLLFADLGKQDACTDPRCYQTKLQAHITVSIAAKPKLVQISTYRQVAEGSPILPRNNYVAIREDKPKDKEQAKRPEFKSCKYTTEAIVAEGEGQGTLQKVCTQADCPVHHPKTTKQPTTNAADTAKWKAEQDKQRRDEAISNTTGIRVLAAIGSAVPARLMRRDLLFVVGRLAGMLDENRLDIVAKPHGIKKAKDSDSVAKLFAAFLRRTEDSLSGRLMVEFTIILAASRSNTPQVLKDAAAVYKVDTDAIAAKVKLEFAVKQKAKKVTAIVTPKPHAKATAKPRQAAA